MPRWLLVVGCASASVGCGLIDLSFVGKACSATHPCPGGLLCDPSAQICLKSIDGGGGGGGGGDAGGGGGGGGGGDAGSGGDGGACTSSSQCSGGEVCNPFSASCSGDALCHAFDGEHPVNCTRHDFYVSTSGDDANDGTTPQTAWATISAHPLNSGDRVNVLPGSYTAQILQDPPSVGSATCPIEIAGPVDGGTATLTQPSAFEVDGWWLHDLSFAVTGNVEALKIDFCQDVRLERLTFHNNYSGGGSPRDIDAVGQTNLQLLDSTFDSQGSETLLISGSTGTLIRGNHFVSHDGHLQVSGDTVLRDNDLTGVWLGDAVSVSGGTPALIVERNVFHEMVESIGNDFTLVVGAALVRSNTFVNASTGLAASNGVFRDNLVSGLRQGSGLTVGGCDGGYNLFDQTGKAYAGADAGLGDVFAPPSLDANEVPMAGSPAIDAADPALPVPPGGGPRADIGARERGSTLTSDGRYCSQQTP